MSVKEIADRNGLTVSRIGLITAILGLVGTVLAFCAPPDAAQDNPSSDRGRTHFQVKLGEFALDGDVVVKGDGTVAASGRVTPEAAAKAAKCRFKSEFTPMSEASKPIGRTETRSCDVDGPEQDFPAFGPVPFDNDKNIAYVKVIVYLDNQVAGTKICRLLTESCEDA